MYTRCPECETWFAIGAAQLRLGRGEVQCGACLETFDALATLADAPSPGSPPRLAPGDRIEPPEDGPPGADDDAPALRAAPPIGDIALLEARPVPEDRGAAPEDEAPAAGGPAAPEEPAGTAEPDDAEPPAAPTTEAPVPDPGALPAGPPEPGLDRAHEDEPVPDVLREDMARLEAARRARRRRSLFFAGSVALVLVLVAQYAWFQPEDLLRRYPAARLWLEGFCAATDCALPEQRDLRRIRMVSRDVRVHPRFEGALQVTASLVNAAPFVQAYPRIQFTLFNVNGQTIATRVFRPADYVGEDIDAGRGMPPDSPVQIVLELVAPDQVAVSFEFRFI